MLKYLMKYLKKVVLFSPKIFSIGLLPPANEVWGKVIFLHLFVILFTGGHVWLWGGMCGCWGACMAVGDICGCWGVCMVGGHAWLRGACIVAGNICGCWGGVRGCWGEGACMVAGGHA